MIPSIVFTASFIAIIALFALKYKENKNGCTLFCNKFRESCDTRVLGLEKHCGDKCTREHLLHTASIMYNTFTHKFAKLTASMAKRIEWRARSVAHKSAKAKQDVGDVRENEFLKDVQNHKDSLDTAKVAEEAKL